MPEFGRKSTRSPKKPAEMPENDEKPTEEPGDTTLDLEELSGEAEMADEVFSDRVMHRTCGVITKLRAGPLPPVLYCMHHTRHFPTSEFDWAINGKAAGPVA
jgi:hypothetical protein